MMFYNNVEIVPASNVETSRDVDSQSWKSASRTQSAYVMVSN